MSPLVFLHRWVRCFKRCFFIFEPERRSSVPFSIVSPDADVESLNAPKSGGREPFEHLCESYGFIVSVHRRFVVLLTFGYGNRTEKKCLFSRIMIRWNDMRTLCVR